MQCRSTRPILLLAFALIAVPSLAARLYVSQTAPGPTHNGASWATAYLKISDAVAASMPTQGAEIWVASGTYAERIQIPSYVYGIQLYGGFAGTETDRLQRNPTVNVTTIDGQYGGSVVTYLSGAYNVNVLDGFTITRGSGTVITNTQTGKKDTFGGGILCMSWSSPVIRNNIVSYSVLSFIAGGGFTYGGGIAVLGGNPVIDGNQLLRDGADYGGGIFCADGTIPSITNNTLQGNSAAPNGAGIYAHLGAYIVRNIIVGNINGSGIYLDGTTPQNVSADGTHIDYNAISGNEAGGINYYGANAATVGTPYVSIHDNLISGNKGDYGAALRLFNSYARINNNTIVKNVTTDGTSKYGAIDVYNETGTGAPILVNNIIAYNTAGFHDRTYTGSRAYFKNNCFYSNGDYDYYTVNPNPDPTTANGNIKLNPGFVHLSTYANLADYRLNASSPCREAGDDNVVATVAVDLDNEPRKDGTHVDMGAYEVVSGVTLSFITQPTNTLVEQDMVPAPTVTILRSNGQIYPHTAAVWLTIKPGTGAPGGYLSCHTTVETGVGALFVNGVATFPGLYMFDAGAGYVITAQAAGIAGDSQPFNITLPRRFVSTTGNDAADGSTWTDAKLTVASALDSVLAPGGEVFVGPGTFTAPFTLPAGAKIYGGFAGSETGMVDRKYRNHTTTLNGGAAGPVITVAAGSGADTIIDGFTITNGSGRRFLDTSRRATWKGGGIYSYNAAPTIQWNHVTGNTATQGGGIYCESGTPVLANNVIEGNTAAATTYYAGTGGGIALYGAAATVAGNLIRNNSANGALTLNHAASSGGALYTLESDAFFRDNTITGNTAASASYIEISISSPRFVNNILALNGGGVNASSSSEINATYNDLYGNAEVDYTGPGTPFASHRNIRVDPLFVDAANANYRLQDASPCINRGYNGVLGVDELDLDLNPRLNDDVVDIGAYERRVLNVVSSKFVDATHVSLGYSDAINNVPANGAYIPTNYSVVDLDNGNAPIAVTVISAEPPDYLSVRLAFATLPYGHRIRITVTSVKSAVGILVNPVKNTTTLLLPIQVTFRLIDNLGVASNKMISVAGTSTGATPGDFKGITLGHIYGTYTSESNPAWITPGVLTYRYTVDFSNTTVLNESDRTYNLPASNPQTIVDITGVPVRTTFNLIVYADKAIPAGKDVYVTGGFAGWSTVPGTSPGPISLTAPSSGLAKGLFTATSTIAEFPWAYRYVLIDRTTSAVDSTFLNAADRAMDIRAYGTPLAFVVNDSAGTATTIEQVVRILRITAGLEPSPSPLSDPAFTSLDLDGSARINLIDAIKLFRG